MEAAWTTGGSRCIGTYEIAAQKNVTPIMSRVYPERKWTKERKDDRARQRINGLKQISILARSMTKRKSDIRGSVEKENSPPRKVQKTDRGFSSIK
jgi:hypothetical protein